MDHLSDIFFQYIEPNAFFFLLPLYLLFEAFFKLNKRQTLLGSESAENLGWQFINVYGIEFIINFVGRFVRVSFIPVIWNTYVASQFQFAENLSFKIENVLLLGVIVFFGRDFMGWVVHRLLHKNSVLWKFHKLHHSSTEINALASVRGNWMEGYLFDFGMAIPMILFDVPPVGYTLISLWEANFNFFIHSNLNLRKGGIFRYLNSPLFHHWHHAITCHFRYGQNFGPYTNLFDRLFGTYYCPDEHPEAYGINDKTFPKSIIARFFYPLIPLKIGIRKRGSETLRPAPIKKRN